MHAKNRWVSQIRVEQATDGYRSPLDQAPLMSAPFHDRVVRVFVPYGIRLQSLMMTYGYDPDGPVVSDSLPAFGLY